MRSAYLQVQSGKLLTGLYERLVESTRLSSGGAGRVELGAVTNVDVLDALRDQFQAERFTAGCYEQINFLRCLSAKLALSMRTIFWKCRLM